MKQPIDVDTLYMYNGFKHYDKIASQGKTKYKSPVIVKYELTCISPQMKDLGFKELKGTYI